MVKALITGGAGFVGHHLVEHILRTTDWDVVVMDRLDTSGNLNRLTDMECWPKERNRLKVVWHDLKAPIGYHTGLRMDRPEIIFHLAASTHVDRSIDDPIPFIMDNVLGTAHILEYARTDEHLKSLLYFGTDEIFGPAPPDMAYKEWDRYKSSNPYSATKAGAEELCIAYENTYGLPIIIAHCMNIFGERQHPEKFIPKCIRTILRGDEMPIIPGSRFWIHARNVAAASLFLIEKGECGEKYNIVGEKEVDNLDMALGISHVIGKELRWKDAGKSRPGHDSRYALDGSKMREMGWTLPVSFNDSLRRTVQWTAAHPEWL